MSANPPSSGLLAWIGSTLRLAVFFPFTAVILLVILIAALVSPKTDLYYRIARYWISWGLAINGVKVKSSGGEKLEAARHYVILANHRSHFDAFAIPRSIFHVETRWVAKRELGDIPLFGTALRKTGQILIDRKDHEQAVRELKASLNRRGCSVVFFAEGRRAPTTALQPFKRGGAAFAIDAGLPVVPVAVSGSEKVLEKHSLVVRPGTINVKIGDPIDVSGMTNDDRAALTDRVRDEIESMLATMEPRPAEQPAAEAVGA